MFVSKSFHRRQNFSLDIFVTRSFVQVLLAGSGKSNMATNPFDLWEAAEGTVAGEVPHQTSPTSRLSNCAGGENIPTFVQESTAIARV